ncbi:MAG: sugar phosphate isomerase/epimerase family protein [Candidatus Brocadiia bacterium]
MRVILFSKMFKDKSPDELTALAAESGVEGFDLCVRPGYPVNPENAAQALSEMVRTMQRAGLAIPMVTGNFDLLSPDHPTAEPILAAMDKADVRLIKLGYFAFDPIKQDYWKEVDRIRRLFEGWQALGRRYGVRICYHTHSVRCMGLNCAALAHLIHGFDPQYIGAYIDPGHMAIEGEEFRTGLAMVRSQLSIVALKDVSLTRKPKNDHGSCVAEFVPGGEGLVDWTTVLDELVRIGYDGPLSVHCEFQVAPEAFMETMRRDVRFFKAQLAAAQSPARRASNAK